MSLKTHNVSRSVFRYNFNLSPRDLRKASIIFELEGVLLTSFKEQFSETLKKSLPLQGTTMGVG